MHTLCLLMGLVAAADEPTVPALVQQQPDFYGAVAGAEMTVTGTLAPVHISIDGEILLTITIDEVRNPAAIRRPPLATMPGYSRQFQISDLDMKSSDKRIVFRYLLRPRTEGKLTLPSLEFAYYNPARPTGNLPSKMVDFPTVTVRQTPIIPQTPTIEVRYPDSFFVTPTTPGISGSVSAWEWAGLGFLPLAGISGIFAWRWWHPEGARLVRIRKIRSVRIALDELARLRGKPEPAIALANLLLRYLWERHGVLAKQPLPTQVRVELEQHGLSPEMAHEAEMLLNQFDQTRFSPFPDEAALLVEQTRTLILKWEGIE